MFPRRLPPGVIFFTKVDASWHGEDSRKNLSSDFHLSIKHLYRTHIYLHLVERKLFSKASFWGFIFRRGVLEHVFPLRNWGVAMKPYKKWLHSLTLSELHSYERIPALLNLTGRFSHYLITRFYVSQLLQDFFHQQYHPILHNMWNIDPIFSQTHRNKALNFSQATIGQCPFFRKCPRRTSRVSLNSVVTHVERPFREPRTSKSNARGQWRCTPSMALAPPAETNKTPKEMVVVGCGSWSMRTNLQKPGNMMKHVCWFPKKNSRFTRDPGTCHGFWWQVRWSLISAGAWGSQKSASNFPLIKTWVAFQRYTYRDHLVVILHLILHLPATILSPWERSKLISLLQGNSTSVAIRCH